MSTFSRLSPHAIFGTVRSGKKTKNSQQRKSLQDCLILLHVIVSVKISSFSFDAAVHALIAFNSVPTPLRLLCEQLTHQGRFKEDATSMFTSRVQHPRRSRADCQVDVHDMNKRVAGDLTTFLVLPKLSLILQLERYTNVIFNNSDLWHLHYQYKLTRLLICNTMHLC